MGVLPVDDVQDVPALEGDAQLVAGDVQVVVRVVVEMGAVVELREIFGKIKCFCVFARRGGGSVTLHAASLKSYSREECDSNKHVG